MERVTHERISSQPGPGLVVAAATVALLVPATATAAEQGDLRVEGAGRSLGAATYLTDTARDQDHQELVLQGLG